MNAKCPTCQSPAPHLHPAVQFEGEVQMCRDSFHDAVTPQQPKGRATWDRATERL